MKSLSEELFRSIESRYGHAELKWTISMPIPGDDDFPVLQLPADTFRYSVKRGYPITLAARKVAKRVYLFVQLESFDLATHAGADWAIPMAYKPANLDQRISQTLGFDEGWEDAEFECGLICDDTFATFWRAAYKRKRFGLTAPDMMSLYPVTLADRELDVLGDVLAKWPAPA